MLCANDCKALTHKWFQFRIFPAKYKCCNRYILTFFAQTHHFLCCTAEIAVIRLNQAPLFVFLLKTMQFGAVLFVCLLICRGCSCRIADTLVLANVHRAVSAVSFKRLNNSDFCLFLSLAVLPIFYFGFFCHPFLFNFAARIESFCNTFCNIKFLQKPNLTNFIFKSTLNLNEKDLFNSQNSNPRHGKRGRDGRRFMERRPRKLETGH